MRWVRCPLKDLVIPGEYLYPLFSSPEHLMLRQDYDQRHVHRATSYCDSSSSRPKCADAALNQPNSSAIAVWHPSLHNTS